MLAMKKYMCWRFEIALYQMLNILKSQYDIHNIDKLKMLINLIRIVVWYAIYKFSSTVL